MVLAFRELFAYMARLETLVYWIGRGYSYGFVPINHFGRQHFYTSLLACCSQVLNERNDTRFSKDFMRSLVSIGLDVSQSGSSDPRLKGPTGESWRYGYLTVLCSECCSIIQ